jgi:hypothetical protein
MTLIQPYEKYPFRIVAITVMFSFLIYITGSLIIYPIGLGWMFLYLGYGLFLELRLISKHCPHCYYYGKICAFGKGKISSLFFKQGEMEKFSCNTFTWKDMIPDLLVFLIPAITGIIRMIFEFNWFTLSLVLTLFLLNSVGNAYIRGQLACNHCKQAQLGCPALELFSPKNK